MKQRTKGGGSSAKSTPPRAVTGSSSSSSKETSTGKKDGVKSVGFVAERSTLALFTLCILLVNGVWGVYHYQHENLPAPMTRDQAGKRGFSEYEAMKHVEALSGLGPHPVGSDALERAVQYVTEASEAIKKSAHWEVDVEVDLFHVKSGTNILVGGLFNGKSLVYSDLSHVVLKITPKYAPEAGDSAILVSSHIDSVFAGEGAGDCSSCVAVMLELARGVSQWAQGFKNSVIFLFNTGEEEGLNGAHSFMTQHPWSDSVQLAIDLEAMGIGGKSSIFQTGSDPWAIENFAMVAKYPAAQIVAEDLFNSGLIKSATDFQVYKELGGLSGLDFAYTDNTAVYHTKNDKLKLLKPGSLQHLGENMLAFLRHAGGSSSLPKDTAMQSDSKSSKDRAIYFDIMGTYMVTYRQSLANMLYNSVIMQSLLIWATSVKMGGSSAAISLVLSFLSNIFMWVCSVGFASVVAFILPFISSSPVPYVSSPWLVLGLFAAPALLGAFTGQHVGFLILKSYLSRTLVETKRKLPDNIKDGVIKLDAERWLYKAGLLQWLVLLMVGNYFKIGASYLALVWLVSPAFAYGLLEATLSPTRMPKPLKTATLMIGLFVPFLLTSGMVIRISGTVIGTSVRFIRNPGSTPDWLINVILAVLIAAIVCLTMVYLLSYVHISGAKLPLIVATVTMFAISLGAVWGGFIPPFTDDTARAINVVHVIDATGLGAVKPEPVSYISLFSTTPGNLIKEAEHIGEGFVCGRDRYLDFVTFSTNYSCWMDKGAESGWHKSDIPEIQVESDSKGKSRQTLISIDTKLSTRWVLGINTEEIEDFQLKDADNSEELIPFGEKTAVDGWHTIQFSGGKNAPTKFSLSLIWTDADTKTTSDTNKRKDNHLLRLRTDVDHLTPPVKNVLEKLPSWCSLFGKSTSPHTLAFLNSLPVEF